RLVQRLHIAGEKEPVARRKIQLLQRLGDVLDRFAQRFVRRVGDVDGNIVLTIETAEARRPKSACDGGYVVNARLVELGRRNHQTRKNLAVAALFFVEHDLDRVLLAGFTVCGDLVFAAHHQAHGAGYGGGADAQFGGARAVERDAQFGAGEKEGRFGTDDAGQRADFIACLARQFTQLVEFWAEPLDLY